MVRGFSCCIRLAASAALVVGLSALLASPLQARGVRRDSVRNPVHLHVVWHPQASGESGLWSDGAYVFVQTGPESGSGVLIDGRSGKRRRVTAQRGCAAGAIGGAWLMFTCYGGNPPRMMLYQLASPGGWRVLPASPEIVSACTAPTAYDCSPLAIGTDWLEYDFASCQNGEHCVNYYVFQNIETGQVEDDPAPAGGTVYPIWTRRSSRTRFVRRCACHRARIRCLSRNPDR